MTQPATKAYPSESYRLHRVSEAGWTEVWDADDTLCLGWVAKRPLRGQSNGPWVAFPLHNPESRHMTRHAAALHVVAVAGEQS